MREREVSAKVKTNGSKGPKSRGVDIPVAPLCTGPG